MDWQEEGGEKELHHYMILSDHPAFAITWFSR